MNTKREGGATPRKKKKVMKHLLVSEKEVSAVMGTSGEEEEVKEVEEF